MDDEPDFGLTIDVAAPPLQPPPMNMVQVLTDESPSLFPTSPPTSAGHQEDTGQRGGGGRSDSRISSKNSVTLSLEPPAPGGSGSISEGVGMSPAAGLFNKLQLVNRIIGRGSTGVVELAVNPETGVRYALKTITYSTNSKDSQKSVARELQSISRNVNCPLLVQYFGAKSSRTLGTISIAMEYMDLGSLHSAVRNSCPIPPSILRVVAIKMLVALGYLHNTLNIIHRDIKPTNMLFNTKGAIKLADFGLARDGVSTEPSTFVGTLAYLAPETFQSEGHSSKATDIWALGISLCELALGVHPLMLAASGSNPSVNSRSDRPSHSLSANREGSAAGSSAIRSEGTSQNNEYMEFGFWDTLEYVKNHPLGIPAEPVQPLFSQRMRHFIDSMLEKDPARRPTVKELLQHPWLKEIEGQYQLEDANVTFSGETKEFFEYWYTSFDPERV